MKPPITVFTRLETGFDAVRTGPRQDGGRASGRS